MRRGTGATAGRLVLRHSRPAGVRSYVSAASAFAPTASGSHAVVNAAPGTLPASGSDLLPQIDGVSRALNAKQQVSQHSDDIFDIAAGDYPAGSR